MGEWQRLLGLSGDAPPPRVTIVLGGARSGKSRLAEALLRVAAGTTGGSARYIATAEPVDDEMRARIAAHRRGRPPEWTTAEVPFALPQAILEEPAVPALVDCLTLWLSNLMLRAADLDAATGDLLAALPRREAPIVFVSNEVGLGLVPETPLGRAFRDAQGTLNQRVAGVADCAVFCAAGLPLVLKSL